MLAKRTEKKRKEKQPTSADEMKLNQTNNFRSLFLNAVGVCQANIQNLIELHNIYKTLILSWISRFCARNEWLSESQLWKYANRSINVNKFYCVYYLPRRMSCLSQNGSFD